MNKKKYPASKHKSSSQSSTLEEPSISRNQSIEMVLDLIDNRVVCHLDQSGRPFATWDDGSSLDTMEMTSKRLYYRLKNVAKKELNVRLNKVALTEIIEELLAQAHDGGAPQIPVHHRIAAGTDGQIFVDLCNNEREVIAVDADGVRLHDINTESPLFIRSAGMNALPNPIGLTGNISLLRKFVNVQGEEEWRLFIVFLLYCLRPNGPYVVLVVSGVAGSSKSTFCKLIRLLIDPSAVPTQGMPRTLSDLMITARNSFLLAFDNVRTISLDISDGICRISTGAGSRSRALFTDTDETLIHVTRPCILNGIGDLVDQPDLVSRCIQLNLQPITERRTDEDLAQAFSEAHGTIFAGLVQALSKTLAALPTVTEIPRVRMADFARFGLAVEKALAWPQGSFMQAYEMNQREQMSSSLADEPVAAALKRKVEEMEDAETFTATPTNVLKALGQYASVTEINSRAWPESPHSLSKRLKKMEPALRACGIDVMFRHSGDRTISVTRLSTFGR